MEMVVTQKINKFMLAPWKKTRDCEWKEAENNNHYWIGGMAGGRGGSSFLRDVKPRVLCLNYIIINMDILF